MRMRPACLLVALACACMHAPATWAQAVYRCVEKGKPVSLQSQPCGERARATAVRPYVPEPAPTANELAWQRHRVEREMAERRARARQARTSASTAVMPAGGTACAQAKAERDAWERQVGLARTIDGMRFWQDRVHRACR